MVCFELNESRMRNVNWFVRCRWGRGSKNARLNLVLLNGGNNRVVMGFNDVSFVFSRVGSGRVFSKPN